MKRNHDLMVAAVCNIVVAIFPISCDPPRQEQETAASANRETYQCIPCGYDCDHLVYDKPGKCPNCH